MNKIFYFLVVGVLTLVAIPATVTAQSTDGCMYVQHNMVRSWVEEYEDPIENDESIFHWYGADQNSYDGFGWRGGSCLAQGGFAYIGWWDHGDYALWSHQYGTPATSTSTTVPDAVQLKGDYHGYDCGSECGYQGGSSNPLDDCFYNGDDYGYFNDVLTTNTNFRSTAPNSWATAWQYFTTWHGGSDFGGEFRVYWTAPKPATALTDKATLCNDGSSGAATLTVNCPTCPSGGSYEWYTASGTWIGTGATIAVTPTLTTTYRAYSRYSGVNSQCFAEVTIEVQNCNANCVTENQIASGGVQSFDWTEGYLPDITINTGHFSSPAYLTDINVAVEWTKTAGSCSSQLGGTPYSNEVSMRLEGAPAGCGTVSLITSGTYSTGSDIGNVVTTFDESSASTASGTPATGTFNPPGNLDGCVGESPYGTWRLWAGDNASGDPLCVYNWNLEVCACRPPTTASANPSTVCSGTGTVSLSVAGGFGDEVRWFTGGCGTTYVGTGNPLIVAAPTSTTTYYANYYTSDGDPCRSTAFCASVTVNVDPLTVAGTTSGGTTPLCEGTSGASPGSISLSGHTGTVLKWEYSTDGGGAWTDVPSSAGLTTISPSGLTAIGGITTYYSYRAVVQSGVCNSLNSSETVIEIRPNTVGGTTATDLAIGCSPFIANLSLSGETGTALQWQQSIDGSAFTNITGATSSATTTGTLTLTGPTALRTHSYRVELSNSPCGNEYSDTVDVIVLAQPNADAGPDNQSCDYTYTLNGSSSLAGATVSGSWSTISQPGGSTVSFGTLGSPTSTVTVDVSGDYTFRWEETNSYGGVSCVDNDDVTISFNNPGNITMLSTASGICQSNARNEWVHIYDVNGNVIASVNDNGNNLGNVFATAYVRSAPDFVSNNPATFCPGDPEAHLNRSFVISSTSTAWHGSDIKLRLYFTDDELSALIDASLSTHSVPAGVTSTSLSDPNGCADDDDVNNINALKVTQVSGGTPEDDVFGGSGASYSLVIPDAWNGPGNATFAANYIELTVNTLSEFWLHGSEQNTPLPVELMYLKANAVNNNYIQVNWATAVEVDNAGFALQRSTNGTDYHAITWIDGNGTTTDVSQYAYNDVAVTKGVTYYYRLKQVDFDGSEDYSYAVTASLNPEYVFTVSDFIPNPATNSSSLVINSAKEELISIVLINALGQEVRTVQYNLSHGINTVKFQLDKLAGGMYTAVVYHGTETTSRQLLITDK